MEFASKNMTVGELNAIVKILGGEEGARSLLRGELVISRASRVLNHLKFIAETIEISISSFTKSSFFKTDGPVRLWFGDNFKSWILPAIPEEIPGFEGKLTQTQLTKDMTDSEIKQGLGQPESLTPTEFAAVIRHLIERQPQGEAGTLLTNGYANIFYVKLEDERVVAVRAHWDSDYRGWGLGADDLGDFGWRGGSCVFLRS